jgi:hypothetical protein
MVARVVRSASAPAVPPLLMARIVKNLRMRNEPIGPWLSSGPSLALLLSVWSLGEAAGCLLGSRGASRLAG